MCQITAKVLLLHQPVCYKPSKTLRHHTYFRLLSSLTRRLTIAIACIISALSATAQVDAEQVMRIGRNILSMEDYMLAIQYFNQAIKAKPYLSDPYFFRALAKVNLEDYKGAEEDCSLALERNKFKAEAYKLRGFARQNMGRDSLAISDYDAGLAYYPLDKYFLYYKAVAQTETERFEGADSTFAILLKAYPGFEEGYEARGRLNAMRGDTVAALADIGRALEISKNLLNARLMRADIEARRRRWGEALTDMDEAIRLRPQETSLYVNRAFLRYNNDDYFGAMSDYNYALQLEPDNSAALFNRGLLRYEVRDLDKAAADFSEVLKADPANFHARFNRGLVNLERKRYRDAIADFQSITQRYPRFYPAFYAIAEARQAMGDTRNAMENVYHAEGLIRKYVSNPEKNPLDRPTIAAAESNDRGNLQNEDESEIDVMNRFNRLVTISSSSESRLSYGDKIKGQVQNRDVRVEPEPIYLISFYDSDDALRNQSNYFRELDELNRNHWLPMQLFLSNSVSAPGSENEITRMFAMIDDLSTAMEKNSARPVDWLGRAIAYLSLKNYDAALEDLDKAIEANPQFTVALMARGAARIVNAQAEGKAASVSDTPGSDEAILAARKAQAAASESIADFDAALALNPRLIYAWFDKGNIYYAVDDFTSALQCFSEAISINPEFGQAYFNRGLTYLRIGNKQQAFADLSKAGELGVLPSYNLLKRMK